MSRPGITPATILNYRHAQRRRVSIFFHTIRGGASRETAFPRYRHVLPPPGGGALRRNVRGPTCGAGETLSPVPTPRGDTPTVHYCTGDPGIEPAVAGPSLPAPPGNRRQHHPLARLSTGYRHALPPPQGAGEEAEGRAGWGLPERNFRVPFCPGRGRAPSPVPSPPVAISPRSTPRGELREEPDSGQLFPVFPFPPGKPTPLPLPGTVYPGYRPDCPRPREGAGEERAARAGRGLPERDVRVSPPGRPGGVGGRRGALRLGWDEGQIGSVHLESMHYIHSYRRRYSWIFLESIQPWSSCRIYPLIRPTSCWILRVACSSSSRHAVPRIT